MYLAEKHVSFFLKSIQYLQIPSKLFMNRKLQPLNQKIVQITTFNDWERESALDPFDSSNTLKVFGTSLGRRGLGELGLFLPDGGTPRLAYHRSAAVAMTEAGRGRSPTPAAGRRANLRRRLLPGEAKVQRQLGRHGRTTYSFPLFTPVLPRVVIKCGPHFSRATGADVGLRVLWD